MKPFLPLLFVIFSCLNSYATFDVNHLTAKDSVEFTLVQENIQQLLFRFDDLKTKKLSKQKILGNSFILSIYDSVSYKPLWTNAKNRFDLIKIIEGAYFEGLNPDDYHVKFIKLHNDKRNTSLIVDAEELAMADIIMTNAILSYSHHMIQGKVNQFELDPNWNYAQKTFPERTDFRLLAHLEEESLLSGFDNIRPKLPMYHSLKKWLAYYDQSLKTKGDLQVLPYPGKALRIGDSSLVVQELRLHLRNFDYSYDTLNSPIFGKELDLALKAFQKYNGLEADGVAGKSTFDAINISLKDRLDIIRVNMERCRWVNGDIPEEFILVNIADFHLYEYNGNTINYECKVVVGKTQNETPIFQSAIKYVVFNPTWTVPYSIASKETLPKLQKDPNYLKKHNMTLLRGGKVIDPASVDFKAYSRNNFPFTVRQEPGPNNALGQVKFIFPNDHAVYLHDTPSKSYFGRSERTFSHGCVRVQDPLTLAMRLLISQGYDKAKIDEVIDSRELKNVYLKKPMPVMLMYWTCYERSDKDKIYFYKDVYGRDQAILKELNRDR